MMPVTFNGSHLGGLYHMRFSKRNFMFYATLSNELRKEVNAAFNFTGDNYLPDFPTAH